MRPAFLLAALPLTSASIAQEPPGKLAAETPGPVRYGLPGYLIENDSACVLQGDKPAYISSEDVTPPDPQADPQDGTSRQKPGKGNLPTGKPGQDPTGTDSQPLSVEKQATTALAPTTDAVDLKVTILADSNRDGKVDVTGETDLVGKDTWTAESGALFIANIVDTDHRCSSRIAGSCADELLDASLPKKPVLDPQIKEKLHRCFITDDEALKLLNETEKPVYQAWSTKDEKYWNVVEQWISECHDASDDVLRNSTYLAPLRTRPNPGLSDSAVGYITVPDQTAASKVRLFHRAGDRWNFVTPNYTFTAKDVKAGLELGIDARDVRRPGGWDGRVTVEFKVKVGGKEAKDSVALRVAPVLTQHHGQPAKQLLTASGPKGDQQQADFIKRLEKISGTAGLQEPLHVFNTSNCDQEGDAWAQDFFESGYTSFPGPQGPIAIHVMIRSAQGWRDAGRKVFQDLRSNTVGAIQHLAEGDDTDSLSNLETLPPYSHNGESYPAGRAIMGSVDGKRPYMMAFLEAQETQAPIELDTSWLFHAHVDQFMQFLPVQSVRGWVMAVADPLQALKILQDIQQSGHGKYMAVSRLGAPADPQEWRVTNTIDDVLDSIDFALLQEECARRIEENVGIIKRKTGISEAEIVRIPMVFHRDKILEWKYTQETGETKQRRQVHHQEPGQMIGISSEHQPQQQANASKDHAASEECVFSEILSFQKADAPPRKLKQQQANTTAGDLVGREVGHPVSAIALYPGTINSIVLDNNQVLAPNPWGPIVNGQDVLAANITAAYAKVNYTVHFEDDWFTHHVAASEIHSGSNVIRQTPNATWW